jgi:hypothetical protein
MEAATTLPFSRVRTFNGELLVDGLRVDDEAVVEMVHARERRGESVDRLVKQMIEVGARVLDREQTTMHADFVKAEFERAARELDSEFVDRARRVADRLDAKVDEVFGPEHGHVTQALARHFGDESSVAVQHKVKQVVTEVSAQMRDDLRRQFTADNEANPLAGFQRATLAILKQAADQQAAQSRALTEQLSALEVRMTELKAEKQRLEEVAAEAERGTAKGRTYEEAVFDALDAIAHAQGDDCDAVGDQPGVGGRKGDVVVAIDACSGPARGRIVFEAKDRRLGKKAALTELDEARVARGAEYAVLVVPSEDELPAKTRQLREYNGDKLFVVFDPEDPSRVALEVAYALARARILMSRGEISGLDAEALRSELERALGAMDDVRKIKQNLTHAANGIDGARAALEAMALGVRGHLDAIGALLDAASAADEDQDGGGLFTPTGG